MQRIYRPSQKHSSFRPSFLILLLILFIVGTSFSCLNLPMVLTGHLKKNPSAASAYTNGVTIFVKAGNTKLAETVTDSKGNFTISFTPAGEESFDFFCTAADIDTLLIASYDRFESNTPEITFYIPGIHKKNLFGKVVCPKCKKTNQVYDIVYTGKQVSGSTETSDNKQPKEEASSKKLAKFYCERDKIEF